MAEKEDIPSIDVAGHGNLVLAGNSNMTLNCKFTVGFLYFCISMHNLYCGWHQQNFDQMHFGGLTELHVPCIFFCVG